MRNDDFNPFFRGSYEKTNINGPTLLPIFINAYIIKNETRQRIAETRVYSHGTVAMRQGRPINPNEQREQLDTRDYRQFRHLPAGNGSGYLQKVEIEIQNPETAGLTLTEIYKLNLPDHIIMNVIDLTTYSEEQLTKTVNPVTFTINPDFSITASEEGENKPATAPEAPSAPMPDTEKKKTKQVESQTAGAGLNVPAPTGSSSTIANQPAAPSQGDQKQRREWSAKYDNVVDHIKANHPRIAYNLIHNENLNVLTQNSKEKTLLDFAKAVPEEKKKKKQKDWDDLMKLLAQ